MTVKFFFKICLSVIGFICVISIDKSFADNLNNENKIRETVEEFCKGEFDGIQNKRQYLVKFGLERAKKEKKRDPLLQGKVFFGEGDPLYVVASYQILSIDIKGNHALATVSYKRLARTKGHGVFERRIIPDYRENDLVRVKLINDGEKWWILDPPLPRVSKDALVAYYEQILKRPPGKPWLEREDISEEQKQVYRKEQEDLEALKKLKEH